MTRLVDVPALCRIVHREGDIQQLPDTHPVHDLWRAIAGKSSGRDNVEQITVFDSVGFALEDYSALTCVYRLALELNEGEDISLVPELTDPKDLFERVIETGCGAHARKAA